MNTLTLYDEALKIGLLQQKDEINALWSFVAALRPKRLLEVGTHCGGTFNGFCKVSDPNGICISLDVRTEEWKNPPNDNSFRITADSHSPETLEKVKQALKGEPLDFLFIDGDHSYDGVKQDYTMYSPLVRSGGWIGFHDVNETDYHKAWGCRVDLLWKELQGTKIEINVYNFSGGVGLIRKE